MPVREIGEPGVPGSEHVRDAGARRPRDHVARADQRLLVAEHDRAAAAEDHEDFLLERVAVRRRGLLAGDDLHVLDPGLDRPGGQAEVAAGAGDAGALDGDRLDVLDVDDRRWPRRGLGGERRRPELGLEDELGRQAVDRPGQRADQAAADVRHPEPREADVLVVAALAEGQHVERLERVKRVRTTTRPVHDAVSGADLGGFARLPREPAPTEDVEDLLLASVLVRRRRPAAHRQLDPANADVHATGRDPDHRPAAAQMTGVTVPCRHFVEVCDPHSGDCTATRLST